MDAPQSFRSAFNGFNRQDVVHYLEYINTKHQTQVNELTAEADDLRRQLEDLQAKTTQVAELEAQLAAMTEERDALHTQLEQMQAAEVVQEPRPEMDGGSQVAARVKAPDPWTGVDLDWILTAAPSGWSAAPGSGRSWFTIRQTAC